MSGKIIPFVNAGDAVKADGTGVLWRMEHEGSPADRAATLAVNNIWCGINLFYEIGYDTEEMTQILYNIVDELKEQDDGGNPEPTG